MCDDVEGDDIPDADVDLVDANEAPEGYMALKMPKRFALWCRDCAFKKHSKCIRQKCEPHNRADKQYVFFVKKPKVKPVKVAAINLKDILGDW